jgi:hypothetical protein
MIKSTTIEIFEEETELAVEELNEQLEDFEYLANTVGIIIASGEYLHTVVPALQEALPFKTVGTETLIQACKSADDEGHVDVMSVNLLIMTSDDVTFETGYYDIENGIDNLTEHLQLSRKGDEKLVLMYVPYSTKYSNDMYIDKFGEVFTNVPLFGQITTGRDIAADIANTPGTISERGVGITDLSYIILRGNVSPVFYLANTELNRSMSHHGIITKCNDNVILEINDMPAADFAKDSGFWNDEVVSKEQIMMSAVLENKSNNERIGRLVICETHDKGIVCGGRVFENYTLKMATMSGESIVATTKGIVEEINQTGAKTVIGASCVGRRLILGGMPTQEFDSVINEFNDDITVSLSYCGSEICPIIRDGVPVNTLHNFTAIMCAL